MLDGKPISVQGSGKCSLIAGTYEVRFVREGQVLGRQSVEVRDQATVAVPVKK